jgi:hypothetical protein
MRCRRGQPRGLRDSSSFVHSYPEGGNPGGGGLVRFLEGNLPVKQLWYSIALGAVVLPAAACGRTGDGLERRLALGFASESRPIAVGVELQLAIERPREKGHFCVGHCGLDSKLHPLRLTRVVSSRPDLIEVMSLDDSDPRAPLVRIRTLAPGQVALTAWGESEGRRIEDSWVLDARPLSRIVVSQTRLPENSRVELLLAPISDDGREVYAGPIASRLQGAAEITADERAAVQVQTGAAGVATLEVRGANRTQLVPLEIGRVAHARR